MLWRAVLKQIDKNQSQSLASTFLRASPSCFSTMTTATAPALTRNEPNTNFRHFLVSNNNPGIMRQINQCARLRWSAHTVWVAANTRHCWSFVKWLHESDTLHYIFLFPSNVLKAVCDFASTIRCYLFGTALSLWLKGMLTILWNFFDPLHGWSYNFIDVWTTHHSFCMSYWKAQNLL